MRIRWRGLELPSRVERDEAVSTDSYGRFIVEPFEHGFGTTIGNSLRRILLSSLEGAGVATVKIEGVTHEFCALDGVLEDVTDILLNIKGMVVSLEGDETKTMSLRKNTAGAICAGDLDADPAITVCNPDHHIATLTANVPLNMEMTVRRGRGYAMAADNRLPEQELGVIPIDTVYSPVLRVRYRTEAMRVGQRTNYDRLVMEIWTKGSVFPEDALVEAGSILRKHLNPFVMYREEGEESICPTSLAASLSGGMDEELQALLAKPISSLDLSVRSNNCLEQARIGTVGELVVKTEADLLRVRSLGKTSLHEVQRKLSDHGLRLGMRPGESPRRPGEMDESDASGEHEAVGATTDGGESAGHVDSYHAGGADSNGDD
jgi:DNA-directed RNA polymerase subunit alpha